MKNMNSSGNRMFANKFTYRGFEERLMEGLKMIRRYSMPGITNKLGAILFCFVFLFAALSIAEEMDKYDPESYIGLSEGEAWDLRYGHSEVAGDYMGVWTVVNCESEAILYVNPDEEAEVIISIPKWAEVEAYYYDSVWFECIYDGCQGYMERSFLTDRPGRYADYPGNNESAYFDVIENEATAKPDQ